MGFCDDLIGKVMPVRANEMLVMFHGMMMVPIPMVRLGRSDAVVVMMRREDLMLTGVCVIGQGYSSYRFESSAPDSHLYRFETPAME